jgi:hypothetical protein
VDWGFKLNATAEVGSSCAHACTSVQSACVRLLLACPVESDLLSAALCLAQLRGNAVSEFSLVANGALVDNDASFYFGSAPHYVGDEPPAPCVLTVSFQPLCPCMSFTRAIVVRCGASVRRSLSVCMHGFLLHSCCCCCCCCCSALCCCFVLSGMYVRVNNSIPVLVVTMSRLMQDFRVVGTACLDVYDIQGRLAATRSYFSTSLLRSQLAVGQPRSLPHTHTPDPVPFLGMP